MVVKELEIEFRNRLTQTEYKYLIGEFHLKNSFFEQTNYYFDTDEFHLKKNSAALRIRNVKNKYELTLKTPAEKGLLETTQILTKNQAKALLTEKAALLPDGEVQKTIYDLDVGGKELICWGSLKTLRAETPYKDGLLVVDKNIYSPYIVDYNLEYEVFNYEKGDAIFANFLKEYKITKKLTSNKIERFYRYLNRHPI